MYYLGLDIGSISVKTVIMNGKRDVVLERYDRTYGRPVETAERVLAEVSREYPLDKMVGGAITGNGGKLIGKILGLKIYNEIVAQSRGTAHYHPEVRTIIEIGGEDAKLIMMEGTKGHKPRVRDFAMNTVCAAGTGSFLDQQAKRLGVNIEKEFAELALKSKKPPTIAGRCSVFAKSDMIHLQQIATPDYDILAGLCFAMARNFRSNLGQGKDIRKPIAFQGGVAANKAMVWAFEDVLELQKGELIIPKHFAALGAIGAVLTLIEEGVAEKYKPKALSAISEYLKHRVNERKALPKLPEAPYKTVTEPINIVKKEKIDSYLGIDIGSISTNVVVVDKDVNVLARRYLMTAGRPIEAVRRGLEEIDQEIGDRIEIKGVCTTGSGRYMIGDLIGADFVKNEITAHATGAAYYDNKVDTIFEIGGQDAKYISMENGAVVDFAMNKVCAAGTGSFLEEQAEKLGIRIKEEFGKMALSSDTPAPLGERCTVFMESDLNLNQQLGVPVQDLVAGLSYSIVANYMNRVVEGRKVGKNIFFQGGTAANRGIKSAFQQTTGKEITVPPHHDVLGAIGCAIIARNDIKGKTKFKGFDIGRRKYSVEPFECADCSNNCEIRRVSIEGEKPLHYGSRCGKFDEEKKESAGTHLPRLFREREQLLLNSYDKEKPVNPNGLKIGIPRLAWFFEYFPFWKAFFTELGYEIVLSDPTNKKLIHKGMEFITAETCYPIKVAHGHVLNLLEKKVDFIFMPSIVSLKPAFDGMSNNYACPYVQSLPYIIESAMDLSKKAKVLTPIVHYQDGEVRVEKDLSNYFKGVGLGKSEIRSALKEAWSAQTRFQNALEKRGREVLDALPKDSMALVLVSRPYNGCDAGMNLQLPDKLRDLGVLIIPMDFLPLNEINISKNWSHMYWRYGQKILQAAHVVSQDPRLNAIYISNFGCGPDSFIMKFFTKIMAGKPYLTIEIDEHSADAGIITRCEAFLDSLKNVRNLRGECEFKIDMPEIIPSKEKRKIYVPYMDDHAYIISAAMRHFGVDAETLPMSDDESLNYGRKYTSGKECYPCITTTGDILKKAFSPGFNPKKSAFFMPTASGPCRFGQYNKFHRIVLDELGFQDVPMILMDQGSGFHKDTELLGPAYQRLACNAVLALDLLGKICRETRPYETQAGETDRVYQRCLDRIVNAVEQGDTLVDVLGVCRRDFENIPIDRTKVIPRIGVIGEIYVRCTEYSNAFTVRALEKIGAEVVVPPLEEWVNYISWERCDDARNNGDYILLAKEKIVNKFLEMDANKLTKPMKGAIRGWLKEASTAEIIEKGRPYVHESIRGETILSMGRAVEYVEHGFHGIVNIIPFNCMPGTIVASLFKRFQQDYKGIPTLTMTFDGTRHTGMQTRLEAFVYQAQQYALEATGV